MKIRLILTAIMALFAVSTSAQELKFKSFKLKASNMEATTNVVRDLNDNACALIKVAIASRDVTFQGNIVDEPIYFAGTWYLYVPAGTRRVRITREGFLPLTVEFDQQIEQLKTYELRIDTPTDPLHKVRAVIMPSLSIGYEPMSYGAMVGVVKKFGGFVRFKSNFESLSTSYSVDINGVDENGIYRWLDDQEKFKRWAVTGGYMQRITKGTYIYCGFGYGERIMAWSNHLDEQVEVTPATYKGIEYDLGMLFRFGSFAFGAGVQSNQFKFIEANINVGLMF